MMTHNHTQKHMTHWRKTVLTIACLLSLLFVAPLAAQEDGEDETNRSSATAEGITLSAEVGFDGLHKGAAWRPVQVTIANEGNATSGRLVVETGAFSAPTYAAPIDLPNQSNKRVSFSVYDNSLKTGVIVRFENEAGESIVALEVDNLRSLKPNDSILYGVVSPRPDSLELLEKIQVRRSDAAVAFLSIDDLPEDKVAWRDLDVLVFNDVDSNQLSAAQRDAITFWVSQGGQLVVTGGASWQKTTAAFADLLPVTISGSESVAGLPALAEAAGEPFRDPGPYVLATSSLRDGELIFHQEGTPILARRTVGRGGVYFLALDPQFAPLDDWDGSINVWEEVATHVIRAPFWEETFGDETTTGQAVESLPELTLPSTGLLLIFMLVYIIVIGPVNYIVLGRLNRRELGWVTIPASIVLFSLIAFLIGLQFKGNVPIVNQLNLVTGRAGQTEAYVQSAVGVYSPGRTGYDITFEDDILVRPLQNFSSALSGDNLEILRDGRVRLPNTIIDVGGVGTLHVNSVRPLPAISGIVTLIDKDNLAKAEVTITNNGDFTFENAILLIGNKQSVDLGDIEPGETKTVTENIVSIARPSVVATSNGFPPSFVEIDTDTVYASPLDVNYEELLGTPSYYNDPIAYPRYQFLEGLYDGYGSTNVWQPTSTISLLGWSRQPLLEIELNDTRHDNSATTLYILELPYEK